jgi:CheY-like chemotaxis protein
MIRHYSAHRHDKRVEGAMPFAICDDCLCYLVFPPHHSPEERCPHCGKLLRIADVREVLEPFLRRADNRQEVLPPEAPEHAPGAPDRDASAPRHPRQNKNVRQPHEARDMAGNNPDNKQASVLIVEDNPDVRDSLAMVLTVEGYEVSSAENGQEALDQLRSHPLPDVILLDLMMPVMDGWEFRKQQRQDPLLAQIPVVVMSAYVSQQEVTEQSLGTAFLGKPINVDRLRNTIEQLRP